MKWLIVLICLFPIGPVHAQDDEVRDSTLKQGDVFVPRKFRIRNERGNCVWCSSSDCFFGAAGWEEYEGMKDRAVREGWGGAGMHNVLKACHDAGIDVVSTAPLTVNGKPSPYVHVLEDPWQVLVDGVANGTGCYIEIPGHAVMVCGLDEDGARILDNNGDLVVQNWSARRFNSAWERHACFPLFNRRRKPKPPPEPTPPQPTPAPVTPPVEVKPVPGPAGPPGKDGKDGAPGKDADISALLAQIADLKKQIDSLKQPAQQPPTRTRIVPAKP